MNFTATNLHEIASMLPHKYIVCLVYDSQIQHLNILCWHNVKFHITARDTYCSLWEKLVVICTKRSYICLVSFVFITDVPRYRAFSPVFIYSVCLYVVVNIMSFLSGGYSILYLFKRDDNISVTVFNIFVIVNLVNYIGIPVLTWIDTPKFVQYLHKWETFQVSNNSRSWSSASTKNNYFSCLISTVWDSKFEKRHNLNTFLIHNCLHKSQILIYFA